MVDFECDGGGFSWSVVEWGYLIRIYGYWVRVCGWSFWRCYVSEYFNNYLNYFIVEWGNYYYFYIDFIWNNDDYRSDDGDGKYFSWYLIRGFGYVECIRLRNCG